MAVVAKRRAQPAAAARVWPTARPLIASFNAHLASQIVNRLCDKEFAGRGLGSAGHETATEWLLTYMNSLGLQPMVQRFRVDGVLSLASAPSLEIVGPAGASIRSLRHRRDFAEHPRSGHFDRPATGVAHAWRGEPVADAWAILDAVPRRRALDALAAKLASARSTGILSPQLGGANGWLSKRIVAEPAVSVPMVAVRPEILRSLEGTMVHAMVPLERKQATVSNVCVLKPGSDPALEKEPLLVTAHYDGVGDDPHQRLPGAGDNASGVAVILEAARVVCSSRRRPRRPVMFAAVDAEELGAVGSLSHAQELAAAGIRPIVLNLDMAGHFSDAVAAELGAGSEELMRALDHAGQWLETPLVFAPVASDNRRYAAAGFVAAGLGLGASGYHTPADIPERVEQSALAIAGRLLLATIWLLAFEGPGYK
jgi:aminopeptidase YwaD